jgi:hypothetical protein
MYAFDPSLLELRSVWRGSLMADANVGATFFQGGKPYLILSDRATGTGSIYAINRAADAGGDR